MSEKTLFHALKDCSRIDTNLIQLYKNDFIKPSYLVTMAAYIEKYNIPKQHFVVDEEHESYLNTIGFNEILEAGYPVCRPNLGKSYSMLTLLENESVTDIANNQIHGCIDNFTGNGRIQGIVSLKEVVGELHDNVWAHGCSTGFSMIQRYKNAIEFALADCGCGFLGELNRVGIQIASHADAIAWCIEKGHSSKKCEQEDDWRQQLPADNIGGSPMGKFARYHSGNNHQGLGLSKLVQLICQYNGTLDIVSGDAHLSIKESNTTINHLNCNWDGVIITFQLNNNRLEKDYLDQPLIEIVDILNS